MRDRKKSTVFTGIALAVTLSLTACGDGDDPGNGTVDPGDGLTTTTLSTGTTLDMTSTTLDMTSTTSP